MISRQRARINGKLVTVVEVKGRGPFAKVTIRNDHGFLRTVRAHQLQEIDSSEPEAGFKFGSGD